MQNFRFSKHKAKRQHLKALQRVAKFVARERHLSGRSKKSLEEDQQLEWENLKPGTTAPDFLPEIFHPFYLAGTALSTLVSEAPEILLSGATGHGFHYPGANYIGPGTPLDNNPGRPTSQMDDLARIHDYQYGQLEAAGVNPYFTFNEADRYMLAHANLETAEGWAIYLGIGMKQIFPDDYTSVDPVPPYQERLDNPNPSMSVVGGISADAGPSQRPLATVRQEEVGRKRSQMLYHMMKATQAMKGFPSQEINQFITSPFMRTINNSNQRQEEKGKEIIAAQVGIGHNLSGKQEEEETRLRRFFLGGSSLAKDDGGLNATAQRSLLNGLQQSHLSLPLLSTQRASFSLSTDRSSAAARKNRSLVSTQMRAPRDYKRQMFTAKQPFSSSEMSLVPSFVRR